MQYTQGFDTKVLFRMVVFRSLNHCSEKNHCQGLKVLVLE